MVAEPPCCCAAGALVLMTMTLSLGDLVSSVFGAPGVRFLFDNSRGLAAAAICLGAFGGLVTGPTPVPVERRRSLPWLVRPALAAVAVGLAIIALLPLPERSDPSFRTYTVADVAAGRADDILDATSGPDAAHQLFLHICGSRTSPPAPGDTALADIYNPLITLQNAASCSDLTFGGRLPAANYSGYYGKPGQVVIAGQAPNGFAELYFEPGPGGDLRRIDLLDLPGHLARGFIFCVQTTAYAHLIAYGPGHKLLERQSFR